MSYKFRVRALNILGESEPSAASRPYVVSGYSNRVYERPVAGPYITFTDAINETTIMLKWMVRFVGAEISECAGGRCVGATCPAHTSSRLPHWSLSPAQMDLGSNSSLQQRRAGLGGKSESLEETLFV